MLHSSPSLSPTQILLHPHSGCLSTSPVFSPPFPIYLYAFSVLYSPVVFYHSFIHTSIHPPSLSHLFYSSPARSSATSPCLRFFSSLTLITHFLSSGHYLSYRLKVDGLMNSICENVLYCLIICTMASKTKD